MIAWKDFAKTAGSALWGNGPTGIDTSSITGVQPAGPVAGNSETAQGKGQAGVWDRIKKDFQENVATPAKDLENYMSNFGWKDLGRTATSMAGGLLGGAIETWNAVKEHASDPRGLGKALRQIDNGFRVGAKAGWGEAGRVASDAKAALTSIGNDVGIVSDKTKNRVQRENDQKILESVRRGGFPVPKNPPVDQNGLLVPTFNPDYAWYDKYVMGARSGQWVGKNMSEYAASAALGPLATNGAKALGAGNAIANTAGTMVAAAPALIPATAEAAGSAGRAYGNYERAKASREQLAAYKADEAERLRKSEANRQVQPNEQQMWGNMIRGGGVGGLGGLLLGGLFGGSTWALRLAILGMILGAMDGRGAFNGLLGSLKNSWNKGQATA